MKKLLLPAVALLVVSAVLGGTAAGAPPGARQVSPTGIDSGDCIGSPCRTIGYALGQASAGNIILVASGTYAEAVNITKRVSLIGTDATIDATGENNGVVVSGPAAAGTTLRGFTVMNALLEGVLAESTSDLTIRDNRVVHNDRLWDPTNVPEPCQSSDDCGEGLHLNSVTHSTVSDNVVQFNVGGILLTDELGGPTSGITIRNNLVLDNEKDCGITLASHYFSLAGPAPPELGGVYDNVIVGNDSERNGAAGIGVFAGPPGAAAYRNLIVGNIARDNGLPGVALHSHTPGQYLNDNAVVGNYIAGNGEDDDNPTGGDTGISLLGGVVTVPRTVIAANLIVDEQFGIAIHNAALVAGLPSNHFRLVAVPVVYL